MVLSRCLKTASDGADATWRGRSFQTVAPETGNARLPTVERRTGGMSRRCEVDDRSRRRRLDVMSVTRASLLSPFLEFFANGFQNCWRSMHPIPTLCNPSRKKHNISSNLRYFSSFLSLQRSIHFSSFVVAFTFFILAMPPFFSATEDECMPPTWRQWRHRTAS